MAKATFGAGCFWHPQHVFDPDRYIVEWNLQRFGECAVRDFLARGERAEDELDRVGASVGAAEALRFVDCQGKLTDLGFALQSLDLPRIGREFRNRAVRIGAQRFLHQFDGFFEGD